MNKTILTVVSLCVGTVVLPGTDATAQPRRTYERERPVVVVRHEPRHAHSRRRTVKHTRHATVPGPRVDRHAVLALRHEQRDLREIRDISRAWHHAVRRRSAYDLAWVDQRLTVWLADQRREARYRGTDPRLAARLRELDRHLEAIRWREARGFARRHDVRRKARILDELVLLSEDQVRWAEARVRRASPWSVAAFDLARVP